MNKGKLEANIQRLQDARTEHLSKADAAKSKPETKHYMMLADKNQEAIFMYRERLEK